MASTHSLLVINPQLLVNDPSSTLAVTILEYQQAARWSISSLLQDLLADSDGANAKKAPSGSSRAYG